MSKRARTPSMKRWSLLRGAAVLLALSGVGLFAADRLRAPARAVSAVPAAAPRFSWARGSREVYAVRWDAGSRRTVLGGNESGDLAGGATFAGDVSIRSLGADASGVYTLVYTLEKVTEFDLALGEGSVFTESDRGLAIAAMIGQEAVVKVDARGVVRSIAYHHGTPASVREQLRHIVHLMQVTLPEGGARTWIAREETPNGDAQARYDMQGDGIRRARVVYQKLSQQLGAPDADSRVSSNAAIKLDPRGVLRSIEDHEQLRAEGSTGTVLSNWSFTAQLGESASFDVKRVRVDDLDAQTGDGQLARERRTVRDARLAGEQTLGSIELEIELAGRGDQYGPTFVPHAAAFVRVHPEACDNLLAWFEDERLTDTARELTMDVLSAAGTDEAQAAMRKALASKAVKLDGSMRARLVQRFIFVPDPNPESARFVADFYERARDGDDPQLTAAAAAALGAIIEHMKGQVALAEELDARLRRRLEERRSVDDEVGILRGLGNARTPADLPAIVAFAGDESANVRLQVARSLKHFSDPAAEAPLLRLARDPSSTVATAAFEALRMQLIADADWEALAKAVETGQTAQRADDALVDLVERRPDAAAAGQRILRAVLARTPKTSGYQEARDHIQMLLGAVAAND